MHGTNVHSTIIPDAIAVIASCTKSPLLMEAAVALRVVATRNVWLPSGNIAASQRMMRNIVSPQWSHAARLALANPRLQYLARHFCTVCIKCVPTTAADPHRGAAWASRVKALYAKEPSMQMLGNALLEQLKLPEPNDVPMPAPAPSAPATASLPDNDNAKRMAAQRRLDKAKQLVDVFMRHWEAQKARAAAVNAVIQDDVAQATTPAFEAPAEALPAATITTPTTEPTSAEPVRIDGPRAITARKPMRSFFRRPMPLSAFITAPSTVPPAICHEMRVPIAIQSQPQSLAPPAPRAA